MQDHFLFDDNDPKQRGKSCDALCPEDKMLKFKWRWITEKELSWYPNDPRNKSKKRRPCQCSEAILENGWRLEATFWHTDYATDVERYGNTVINYHRNYDEGTKENPPLLTRLDAQLKAEQLFEELGKDILRQC